MPNAPDNLLDTIAGVAKIAGTAGYCASLDSATLVPTAQLGTGATSTAVFLRGDRTWAAATGGALSGAMVQQVTVSVQGFTTTNGIHAGGFDNVPVRSTEGSGFGLTVNLKPTSTANNIYVMGNIYGDNDTLTSDAIFWGLFLAGSTTAIVAGGAQILNAVGNLTGLGFHWKATTVSTATTSYAMRVGTAGSGATFTLNGTAGAGLFGNALVSSLTVWEVQN